VATEVAAAYVELGARIGKLEAGLAAASAQVEGFAKKADARAASTSASFASMGRGVKIATLAAAGGLALAVKSAANFDSQMSQVRAVTGATSKQMDALRTSALKVSASAQGFGYTAREVAQAQTELGKAGLSVAQIMGGGMTAALTLAKAGGLQLGDAAAYTANAMAQFNMSGKQAGQVADAMATAANATTADVGDFGAALVQTGAAAKSAGLTFNDTMTVLTALAKSGVKGSDAGTSLKTSLIQLVKPTNKQAEAAKAAGISFLDQNKNMRSLADISAQLRSRTATMTQAQRTALFATLAGTDGVRTLLALYNSGPGTIAKYSAQLNKSGSATEMAATMNDNAAGRFKQLMATLTAAGIQIGDALLPPLAAMASAFARIIGAFTAFKPIAYGVAAAIGVVVAAMAVNKVVAFGGAIAQAARHMGLLAVTSTAASTVGSGITGVGVAAATAGPRAAMAAKAMQSFGAAAGILTGGLRTLGPVAASQAGNINRVKAAGWQAKLGMTQLASAIPLVSNPLGLLATAVGVGAASLFVFGKRTNANAEYLAFLGSGAANARAQIEQTNAAISGQAQANQQMLAMTKATAQAKQAETAAVSAYLAAFNKGRAANESEAAFQARLVGLYRQVTAARAGVTQAQNTSTDAVRRSVDGVTKLADASSKEIETAKRRVEQAKQANQFNALIGKSDEARAKAAAELTNSQAALAVAESRRGQRLREVERAQVATREAIKKSSMTDAEKAASLEVVNKAISRTRGEIKSLPESKTTKIKAINEARATIEAVKAGLGGIDRFVTVTIKAVKEGTGWGGFRGGFAGFAGGGVVRGPAGRDVIPAMLTAGEVVLTKRQQAMVNGGMNIRDAIRKTGGAFAKGGFVPPKRNKDEKGDAYRKRVAAAKKRWKSTRMDAMAPAFQAVGDAMKSSYLDRFDKDTSRILAGIEKNFTGSGKVAGKSFAQLDKDLANNLKSIEANFKGTGTVAGLTFKNLDSQMRKAQAALTATFDALTPAEQRLKDMQTAADQANLQGAITDAQAALANAQQFGDADAIRSAQKALGEAQRAEQMAQLQTTADQERALREGERQTAQDAFDAEWEGKRADLQTQLDGLLEQERTSGAERQAELERQLAERLATEDANRAELRMQREIELEALAQNLMNQRGKYLTHFKSVRAAVQAFANKMRISGANIGKSIAEGLDSAKGELRGAAAGLATILSEWLKTRSPSKRGPLSSLDTWMDGFAPALMSGMDTGAIEAGIASAVAAPSIVGGAGAGGALTINLTVTDQTFAGMSRDQADRVASQIQSALNRRVSIAI
jgi:TP901 family phage tail tape measure protein